MTSTETAKSTPGATSVTATKSPELSKKVDATSKKTGLPAGKQSTHNKDEKMSRLKPKVIYTDSKKKQTVPKVQEGTAAQVVPEDDITDDVLSSDSDDDVEDDASKADTDSADVASSDDSDAVVATNPSSQADDDSEGYRIEFEGLPASWSETISLSLL